MKRVVIITLLSLIQLAFSVRVSADSDIDKYIAKYKDLAVIEMYRSGIPASITMAQGMLESSYGNGRLAREANNHFGIKCHNTWEGERIFHDDDKRHECFRKYRTVAESFEDHSNFIRYSTRYSALFDLKVTDYKGWANGLKKAGYATDPRYAQKLIGLIESHKLYKLDTAPNPAKEAKASKKKDKKDKNKKPAEPEQLPETPAQLAAPEAVYDASWSFSIDRQVFAFNGSLVIYTFPDDTFASIAQRYNLFEKELLSFNDLASEPETLAPGTMIYIKRKKAEAKEGQQMHVVDYEQDGVSPDEILWWISQKYGVRLKSILKMNHLAPDAQVVDGQQIKLRRK